MSKRIVISYKEFLIEALDHMSYRDIFRFYEDLCNDAYETEEFGGASVIRTNPEEEKKADIVFKYIADHYGEEYNDYLDDRCCDCPECRPDEN